MPVLLNPYRFATGAPVVGIFLSGFTSDPTDLTNYSFASFPLGTEGASRVFAVGIAARSSTAGRTISSVTVAGNAATARVTATNADSGTNICAIYSLALASGTSGTVAVNFSGSMLRCGVCVWNILNASGAVPHDTDSDITIASGVLSGAGIDVPANGAAVGICHHTAAASFTWTNLTEDADTAMEGGSNTMSGAGQAFVSSQTNLVVTATSSDTSSSINGSLALASWGP